MTRSAKNYCFTINNWTEEDKSTLQTLYNAENHRYLCFGFEIGDQGTKHIQGYICFNQRRTFRWVKNHLPSGAHIEQAKGSPHQNREYCRKEEDEEHGEFCEYGQPPAGQGARTDIDEFLAGIREGKSLLELADTHGSYILRYHRGAAALRCMYSKPRDWKSEVFVYWGKTGTGKTKKAFIEMCDKKAFIYPGGGWFDGYDGQKDAIFDDFTGGEFKLTYLLRLLDWTEMKVPIKGDFVQWVPRRIFITSNLSPMNWYANAHPEHQEALQRRLEHVEYFE